MNSQFEQLAESICDDFDVTLEEVKSKTRLQQIADVRHLVAYCLVRKFSPSLREVGGYLGGRDHSTVINSIRKVQELQDLRSYANAKLKTHIPDKEYLNIIQSMNPNHPQGNIISYK